MILFLLYSIIGHCHDEINPCTPNGICLQVSATHFLCQCNPDYTGALCQTAIYAPDVNILNACKCVNGGVCSMNGTCSCPDHYRGKFCQLGLSIKAIM